MEYWARVPTLPEDGHLEDHQLQDITSLFHQKPSDRLHLAFIVLITADDELYVASHALLRLCGSLAELLDEIDADTAPTPYPADASTAEVIEVLPSFEVDAPSAAVRSVLEFLALWLRNGRPSVLARPLSAPLQHLVTEWEWEFLKGHSFAPRPKRPSAAATLAAVVPFVRDPTATRLLSQQRGTLTPPAIAPLLQLMRAADFLCIDSLRDLSCAFLASLVMDRNETELADLLDLDRPLTEAELEPMFAQHPFLRPTTGAAAGSTSVVTLASPVQSTPVAAPQNASQAPRR
jgi:hypothetical protein